ncbi:MAG: radical SAM family heme chaperone HemW [Acidobacteriaceae bacterium]|nr:radical SAM family heme chaperone HemW [Acidobacteriaceae bacterium]
MRPLGVYLSIPFCRAKCAYCNFASGAFGSGRLPGYVDRLDAEMRSVRSRVEPWGATLACAVDSVYFGGGTPSLLPPAQIAQIFRALRDEFDIAGGAEITIECAPGQLADETFEEMLRQGVNRISLGVQSFVDREAALVGRKHTRALCEQELRRFEAAGIGEINIDLIIGLPCQTEESWLESVEQAARCGAPHVSMYALEVDEDSRLGREVLAHGGGLHASEVPDEDTVAAWYQSACERLDAAGIEQYEISNFAREGHRSRHNLKYWHREPYLGFGLDAHSMLPVEGGFVRFANTGELDIYLAAEPARAPEVLGENEAFEESLFLGLRLTDGVSLNTLRTRFGVSRVEAILPAALETCEAGLLALHNEVLRLTARGRMASNEVFSRLLIPTPV